MEEKDFLIPVMGDSFQCCDHSQGVIRSVSSFIKERKKYMLKGNNQGKVFRKNFSPGWFVLGCKTKFLEGSQPVEE